MSIWKKQKQNLKIRINQLKETKIHEKARKSEREVTRELNFPNPNDWIGKLRNTKQTIENEDHTWKGVKWINEEWIYQGNKLIRALQSWSFTLVKKVTIEGLGAKCGQLHFSK